MEFFIDKSNHLYVNEIAPRPHNSGHYTIEACDYSQFDTHILAVTGQDLPQEIEILKPAVMMNLLGRDLDLLEDNLEIILNGMSTSMEKQNENRIEKWGI